MATTTGRGSHRLHHRLGHAIALREADKHVGVLHRVRQRPGRSLGRQRLLVLVHAFFASLVNHALGIAKGDVLGLHAEIDVVLGGGDRRSPSAVEHDLDLVERLAHNLHRVQQARAGDDRRSMLIVMEYRDLHRFLQPGFDLEAFRSLDVFQVDAAEGGLKQLHALDDVFHVLRAEFNVEHVDIGESLEQNSLAFHDRLAGHGADIAQPEHRRAVGEYRNQVPFCGVLESVVWVLLNVQAGCRNPRCISQAEVMLGSA